MFHLLTYHLVNFYVFNSQQTLNFWGRIVIEMISKSLIFILRLSRLVAFLKCMFKTAPAVKTADRDYSNIVRSLQCIPSPYISSDSQA